MVRRVNIIRYVREHDLILNYDYIYCDLYTSMQLLDLEISKSYQYNRVALTFCRYISVCHCEEIGSSHRETQVCTIAQNNSSVICEKYYVEFSHRIIGRSMQNAISGK